MKLALVLTKPPYGNIQAAEAVRHAMGALSDEIETRMFLCEGGVLLAIKNQSEDDTGYTNLAESLKNLIDLGADVFAEKSSLRNYELEADSLVEGVGIKNGYDISEMIKESDKTMIF
ncbi:sulfur relay protein TusC [bacterium BMS3Bbin06]|nr:sulfur relay protein TusC [bacterium BMS3Abin08]GBE35217.1 sulfur relay protein TusC [bacterium BMS3Bbin06]HDO36044.1 hypothetical protein [Nitrospirota bacterium]HDY70656.1 hypothetical protein [Nitrospirota bacterium]